MNAQYILELVKCIGLTYSSLAKRSLVARNLPPKDPSSAFYFLMPAPGLDLFFVADDDTLNRVLITKKKFHGTLPKPIEGLKNKDDVLAQFGKPTESTGYRKLPGDLGEIGGTDRYHLPQTNRNAQVIFTYSISLEIQAITFDLIES